MSTVLHTPAWVEEKDSLVSEDENLQEQVPSLTLLGGGLSLDGVIEDEPSSEQWYQSPRYRFKDENEQDFPAWEEKKLGEVAGCLDHKRKPLNSLERDDAQGEIPYYGANSIQGYVKDYIFDEDLVLLAEDGGNFHEYQEKPISYYVTGKSWVNNHAHVLKAKEGHTTKFLHYSLEHKDIRKFVNGQVRAKLNKNSMLKIPLPLPSLPEQEKIAGFLGALDDRITGQEKLVDLLEQRKKAYSQRIFNGSLRFKDENGQDYPEWEEKKLGEVAGAYQPKTLSQSELDGGKYKVYGANGVIGSHSKYNHKRPEVLVTCRGNTVGTLNMSMPYSWINGNAMVIAPKEGSSINKSFLFQKLKSSRMDKIVEGSGQPQITRQPMLSLLLPLPSLPEQEKIAGFLGALDTEVEQEKKKLEAYKEEKKAFSQRIFGL